MKKWIITDEQRKRLLAEARKSIDYSAINDVLQSIDYSAINDVLQRYAILRGRVQGCMENLVEMVEETDDER